MADSRTFTVNGWQTYLPTVARWIPASRPVEVDPGHNGGPAQKPAPVAPRYRRSRRRWSVGEICAMIGFAVTMVCVTLICTGSHQAVTSLLASVDSMGQARQAIEKIELLHSDLKDVESSARSFAISGKQSHLDPYYLAAKSATQNLQELKKMVEGDPRLSKQVNELEPWVVRHLGLMRDMVDLGNKHMFRAIGQTSLTDQGHTVMGEIRLRIAQLLDDERRLLSEQEKLATTRAWTVRYTVFTACVVAVALGIVMIGGLHRALLARQKTEAKAGGLLEATAEALLIIGPEGRIVTANSQTDRYLGYTPQELLGQSIAILLPERFRNQQMKHYIDCFANPDDPTVPRRVELYALRKDGTEFPVEITITPLETEDGLLVSSALHDISLRRRAEEEIQRLNRELDRRSTQFEATSKELEAFSYSVSHDLRAPLRSIDGFSQVLLEDYSPRLDTEGKDCLQRVRAGCQRMGEIIDALLQLSRMTRIEMHRTTVDLSAMAWDIANDLKKRERERLVDFVIAAGITADGDEKLLRVVLENLIGNAWKFTAKKPAARIEFGTLPADNGRQVYFVRDDGAGFDMEHAGKLFTAFKRLHETGDFPGTGIGLTTVQRVVTRHGGKIWADGAVGKGATFCFTLS